MAADPFGALRAGPDRAVVTAGVRAADGRELLAWSSRRGTGYWTAVAVLALLAAGGAGALAILASSGPEPRDKWGYPAATLAFLLSTMAAAPLAALIPRLANSYWGIPLHRIADLFGLSGVVVAPLFIVLLFQLPDWHGRQSMWSDWPGAPQAWDVAAVALLALAGLGLAYVGAIPDLAARKAGLSLGWTGTVRSWTVLPAGLVLLSGFYAMVLVYLHVVLTSDLSMSLVPNWQSAEVPPFHIIAALQAGIATALLAAWLLRRLGHLERYLDLDPFWSSAKLLLALAMLFFYFFWSEFLVDWYGRTPKEDAALGLVMFGPYVAPFAASLFLQFVLPLALLIWNRVRVSIGGPVLVSASVVAGNYLLQIWLFVPAWSVAGPVRDELQAIPPIHWPGALDVLIMVGWPAAAVLIVLLALRVVPAISVWERKRDVLLRFDEPYLTTEIPILAKPS